MVLAHIEVACVDFDRFAGIRERERQGTVLNRVPCPTADRKTKEPYVEASLLAWGDPSLRVVPGTS